MKHVVRVMLLFVAALLVGGVAAGLASLLSIGGTAATLAQSGAAAVAALLFLILTRGAWWQPRARYRFPGATPPHRPRHPLADALVPRRPGPHRPAGAVRLPMPPDEDLAS